MVGRAVEERRNKAVDGMSHDREVLAIPSGLVEGVAEMLSATMKQQRGERGTVGD